MSTSLTPCLRALSAMIGFEPTWAAQVARSAWRVTLGRPDDGTREWPVSSSPDPSDLTTNLELSDDGQAEVLSIEHLQDPVPRTDGTDDPDTVDRTTVYREPSITELEELTPTDPLTVIDAHDAGIYRDTPRASCR